MSQNIYAVPVEWEEFLQAVSDLPSQEEWELLSDDDKGDVEYAIERIAGIDSPDRCDIFNSWGEVHFSDYYAAIRKHLNKETQQNFEFVFSRLLNYFVEFKPPVSPSPSLLKKLRDFATGKEVTPDIPSRSIPKRQIYIEMPSYLQMGNNSHSPEDVKEYCSRFAQILDIEEACLKVPFLESEPSMTGEIFLNYFNEWKQVCEICCQSSKGLYVDYIG